MSENSARAEAEVRKYGLGDNRLVSRPERLNDSTDLYLLTLDGVCERLRGLRRDL